MSQLFEPLKAGDLLLPNRIVMAPMTRSRAGGRILAQLWHVGRISDPSFLDGHLPVAPSAVAAECHVSLLRPARPFVTPRPLEAKEIPDVIEAYRRAAKNAQAAGFDGVELHVGNGYLLDQFLQDSTNRRTDEYGGPIENRARLMFDATDAAVSVWGPGRVGMNLSPRADVYSMGDSDRAATFGYVARELGKRGIAFLCSREAVGPDSLGPQLKAQFGGAYIANEGFTRETAEEALALGTADAVAFGKLFHRQPGPPCAVRTAGTAQRADPGNLLRAWAGGLCRLSGAGTGRRLSRRISSTPGDWREAMSNRGSSEAAEAIVR
jgi:2,4-dienoyl-CoA reductase-like NADH-dependent reductase (Old Yellow Enzyme family)